MGNQTDNKNDNSTFTQFLNKEHNGKDTPQSQHYLKLYNELRKIAIARRAQWNGNETIGVSALVNETYIKLFSDATKSWNNRKEFYSYASKAMRHLLINYARSMQTSKRGGNVQHTNEYDHVLVSADSCEHLLEIDEALNLLAEEKPRYTIIVEMKVFGGFTTDEIAEFLELGSATVKRDWKMARLRLYQYMQESK